MKGGKGRPHIRHIFPFMMTTGERQCHFCIGTVLERFRTSKPLDRKVSKVERVVAYVSDRLRGCHWSSNAYESLSEMSRGAKKKRPQSRDVPAVREKFLVDMRRPSSCDGGGGNKATGSPDRPFPERD